MELGQFSVASRGIWQNGPQNFKKFTAENCGPYLADMNSGNADVL